MCGTEARIDCTEQFGRKKCDPNSDMFEKCVGAGDECNVEAHILVAIANTGHGSDSGDAAGLKAAQKRRRGHIEQDNLAEISPKHDAATDDGNDGKRECDLTGHRHNDMLSTTPDGTTTCR